MSETPWAQDLITLEEVKRYLTIGDASHDALLQDLISETSSDCQERVCDRYFLKATYTDEKYDGDGTNILLLNQYPIVSIASLVIQDGGSALVLDTDYVKYDGRGEVRLLSGTIPVSIQKVVVTYDAGYDTISNLPRYLRQSIKSAVAYRYRIITRGGDGIISQALSVAGAQQQSQQVTTDYPAHVLSVWKSMRRKGPR